MQQEALTEALKEADKPLARYKDDKDRNEMLRNIEREGDPMLAYMQKKKQKGTPGKKGITGTCRLCSYLVLTTSRLSILQDKITWLLHLSLFITRHPF